MQPVYESTNVTGCAQRRVRHQTSVSAPGGRSPPRISRELDVWCGGRRKPNCGRLASPRHLLCSEPVRLRAGAIFFCRGDGTQSPISRRECVCGTRDPQSCYSCGFVAGQRQFMTKQRPDGIARAEAEEHSLTVINRTAGVIQLFSSWRNPRLPASHPK